MTTSPTGKGSLVLYRNEPVIRFLFSMKLEPICMGAIFAVLVSTPLTLAGYLTSHPQGVSKYIGYFENISWSISMICIFPIVVVLTAKFYLEIAHLFEHLGGLVNLDQKNELQSYFTSLNKRFNKPIPTIIVVLVTVALSVVYQKQILNNDLHSWITNGTLLKELMNSKSGYSYAGLLSAVVQIGLTYWVFNLLWKCFVFCLELIRFFKLFGERMNVDPLKTYKCCVFERIWDVGKIFNLIYFLLGVYLSLKVMDKTVIQNLPITNDIGNPVMLGFFVIFFPLLYLPLSAPHKTMKRIKQERLAAIVENYSIMVNRVLRTQSASKDDYEMLEKLDSSIQRLDKQIPVWPFNFKSMESFFGTIVVPMLPLILPFIVEGIKTWASGPKP